MITRMSHTSVFVLDQDSAKAFYTEKLGFEVRFDITMGEEFEGAGAGFRWLTVGPKEQPDLQIIFSSCDMGRSPEAAAQLRDLVAGGSMGVGVMRPTTASGRTRSCWPKGVTFLAEPAERPYGIEATLRDDSGNMMSLVQPFAFDGLDGLTRARPAVRAGIRRNRLEPQAGCPAGGGASLKVSSPGCPPATARTPRMRKAS